MYCGLTAPDPKGERGSFLIEVLVGAVVILMVMTAVLLSMDLGSTMSRLHRDRAVAADLAQQDMERMRALPVTTLSNYRLTRSVAVGGTSYTVVSRTTWVRDASGAVGCTADTTGPQYLALLSTVTWPRIGTTAPVTETSLLTPTSGVYNAGQGSAAVQLVNSAGVGLPGLTASLTGPVNVSDVTDASGCAVFGDISAGAYTLNATGSGMVDVAGNTTLTMPASVVAASTHLFTAQYDVPATATVSFDTKVGSSFVPAQARAVSVTAPTLAAPRTFAPGTVPASPIVLNTLFPFTSGYAVYAGDCLSADPRNAPTSNASYFTTNPGQITTAPNGTPSTTVHMPAINIIVKNSSGTALAGAHVRVIASGTGCGTFPIQTTSDGTNGVALGALRLPAFPFGNYTICADDAKASPHKVSSNVAIVNTSANGTAVTNITLSSFTTGLCP